MKIGELATRSAVSIDAVRFYERRGVLPRADRTASGYRLALVRQLQDLGLTLDEVVEVLQAFDRGGATCASERWRLEAVATRIDERIRLLQTTRRTITAALAACDTGWCGLESN